MYILNFRFFDNIATKIIFSNNFFFVYNDKQIIYLRFSSNFNEDDVFLILMRCSLC